MKNVIAEIEERYVWECPYCEEMCDDLYDDPENQDVVCEHCGKTAHCERTQR
jgi:hypothetical protein